MTGSIRALSWNVNGIRAAYTKKGFVEWLIQTNPDIMCLQETKAHPDQLPAALKEIDDLDLEDYSALHQIGADSIDNLSRYFELKTFSGDATDEVRFEHSEFQRAIEAEKDYFLAVVSGLEEGKDTEIRIFADPLRTLQLKRVPQIRLGGIRSGGKSVLRLKIDTPSGAKPK